MMRRLLLACAVSGLVALPAAGNAETLDEATAAAFETNPSLAAARARLRATRELEPQAWSEAFPALGLNADATRDRGDLGDTETWSARLEAEQLLFSGGRVLAATRQARANVAGAVANFSGTSQQLALDVAAAYAGVRQAEAIVAARQTTVSNLRRQFEYATAQFETGLVTRTDVAQSQARLAQARTQLVQAQGRLSAAVETYLRLVGHPPADLSAPPAASGLPASLDDALERAGRQSPTLNFARASAQAADAGTDIAIANFLPNISLFANTTVSDDFDSAPGDFNADQVGVRVAWSLFTGGFNRSRTRQQRALSAAARLDVSAAERSVRETVTTSWTGLTSARAAVASAREQVAAAELAYEGITLEQETGLRSTIDVLIQEQDLLDARLALAQAERDLVVAERQLLAAIGALAPEAPAE